MHGSNESQLQKTSNDKPKTNGGMKKGIKGMKDTASLNTESIVFVVEQDQVRRLLGMFLAATDLDARTYSNCDEFMARHDSSRTEYLVLDMLFPGMEGLIIRRRETGNEELSEKTPVYFQGTPIKSQQSCESFLFTNRLSNTVISDSADGAFLNARELRL
jgi:hypothetical protein